MKLSIRTMGNGHPTNSKLNINKHFDKILHGYLKYATVQWFCSEYNHDFMGFLMYDEYSVDDDAEALDQLNKSITMERAYIDFRNNIKLNKK
jgi:hypothetical protein